VKDSFIGHRLIWDIIEEQSNSGGEENSQTGQAGDTKPESSRWLQSLLADFAGVYVVQKVT
jgi:hypothetical protein